ncbi:sigma-54-dependent transcriptional regulator [Vibrio sagamiensis]|uniref:Sigma-54-dependent Fis family transcriptional regulator n=1 Tax=Vibrio sagamiensis NBRC 104589 TaxID=1219064 RepID=A0A511QA73_9VIBR|nr:VpsR-related response regulator [Vibrio sagamiensis]PNQ53856.1 sigma-54-dependent Fis family transcriptional regulator [Vibrio agarivorans]GEM74174.1 sigma-54-dependent Fis family transcriptional regulator [Vibrio sagamiensis NBRC 104589]
MIGQFKMDSKPGVIIVIGGTHASWLSVLEKAGWQCHQVGDLRQANILLEKFSPCIGIVDLSHDEFSLNGLASLVSSHKYVRWLALIKELQLSSDTTCQFIVNFCIDFFTDPIPDTQLLSTIGHQLGMLKLEKKVCPSLGNQSDMGLVGESYPLRQLREQIKRIAPTDVGVFLHGENGVGKETVARAIHKASSRAHKPFFSISCRTLNEKRFQMEVFGIGSEAGDGPCILEQAEEGTVLFNDILMISKQQQQNLLRFLQENSIETIDGIKSSNVRILVTNASDIEKALLEGDFNEELYHHISVMRINVPSLKERPDDIGLLANSFLNDFSKEYHSQAKGFSEDTLKAMIRYSWPGNVRELNNQIRRAVLLCDDVIIQEHHMDLPKCEESTRSLKSIREKSERDALVLVLESHKGQVSNAAKELGISRATMYRLLNKHGLIDE